MGRNQARAGWRLNRALPKTGEGCLSVTPLGYKNKACALFSLESSPVFPLCLRLQPQSPSHFTAQSHMVETEQSTVQVLEHVTGVLTYRL